MPSGFIVSIDIKLAQVAIVLFWRWIRKTKKTKKTKTGSRRRKTSTCRESFYRQNKNQRAANWFNPQCHKLGNRVKPMKSPLDISLNTPTTTTLAAAIISKLGSVKPPQAHRLAVHVRWFRTCKCHKHFTTNHRRSFDAWINNSAPGSISQRVTMTIMMISISYRSQ